MTEATISLKDIGERIMILRKKRKLSQEELAEKAGVSNQVISTAERGVKEIKLCNFVRISIALDVTTDYLLTGKDSSSKYLESSPEYARLARKQVDLIHEVVERCIQIGIAGCEGTKNDR